MRVIKGMKVTELRDGSSHLFGQKPGTRERITVPLHRAAIAA